MSTAAQKAGEDAPHPTSTRIFALVTTPSTVGTAQEWGLEPGVTAQQVIEEMRQCRTPEEAISDYELAPEPTITISVVTTMSDGTERRSSAEWTQVESEPAGDSSPSADG